jgi:hypothetical protein
MCIIIAMYIQNACASATQCHDEFGEIHSAKAELGPGHIAHCSLKIFRWRKKNGLISSMYGYL